MSNEHLIKTLKLKQHSTNDDVCAQSQSFDVVCMHKKTDEQYRVSE